MPFGWVAAAGAIGGALINSSASGDAANAQRDAAANSTAEQRREFDIIQGLYAPQRNFGIGAMGKLGSLFGINTSNSPQGSSMSPQGNLTGSTPTGMGIPGQGYPGYNPLIGSGYGNSSGGSTVGTGGIIGAWGDSGRGILPGGSNGGRMTAGGPGGDPKAGQGPPTAPGTSSGTPDYSGFYNSPGFQFSLDMGRQGVNRNAAAAGSLYAPNTMGAVNYQEQGIASSHYNDYVNQLLQMAGLGSAATSGTAGAAYNTGANISSNMLSAGNANASGILGSAGAWQSALNSAGGYFGNNGFTSGSGNPNSWDTEGGGNFTDFQNQGGTYSDRRLKSNIVKVGTLPSGLSLYDYTIGTNREIGVMADEVEKIFPEAVTIDQKGYKLVNYARIH